MDGLKGNGIMERISAPCLEMGTNPKQAYANLFAELRRYVVDYKERDGDIIIYTTQENRPRAEELCRRLGVKLSNPEPSDFLEEQDPEEQKRLMERFRKDLEKVGVKVT